MKELKKNLVYLALVNTATQDGLDYIMVMALT